jgi:hypothetical protein
VGERSAGDDSGTASEEHVFGKDQPAEGLLELLWTGGPSLNALVLKVRKIFGERGWIRTGVLI